MHIRPINELDAHFHKPWGLLLILWDEQQRELFGLSNVIDAFEQIMQDPMEKRNLSPYIADLFSDLAILSRALHEIEIYQPWAATFEEEHKASDLCPVELRFHPALSSKMPARLSSHLLNNSNRNTKEKFSRCSRKLRSSFIIWKTWTM
jgi:hypothetical protein